MTGLSSIGWVEIEMRIFRFGAEMLIKIQAEALSPIFALLFRTGPIALFRAIVSGSLVDWCWLTAELHTDHLLGRCKKFGNPRYHIITSSQERLKKNNEILRLM